MFLPFRASSCFVGIAGWKGREMFARHRAEVGRLRKGGGNYPAFRRPVERSGLAAFLEAGFLPSMDTISGPMEQSS